MKCPNCGSQDEMVPHRRLVGILICQHCWFKIDPKDPSKEIHGKPKKVRYGGSKYWADRL